MPCYHLDSHFPRGKSLCKCLVCIETLTLCFVTGNCRRSLLVILSVRRSGMYSQSRLPRLSPPGCSLSERVFVTSSRLRVFYIIQYKFRFVKCFFVNNRGCKKRTPFLFAAALDIKIGNRRGLRFRFSCKHGRGLCKTVHKAAE